MKTRITVLNARNGTWPGKNYLASCAAVDGGRPRYEYCCIGCNGLTFGLSTGDMLNRRFAFSIGEAKSWPKAWSRNVTVELLEELYEIDPVEESLGSGRLLYMSLEGLAANINDKIAPNDPDLAVELLRPIFREVGLNMPEPERWIIRYLRKEDDD